MSVSPTPRSNRRALTHGRRVLGATFFALPIAALVGVALSRLPGLTRDVAVSIGFYLLIPTWVTVACRLFVATRPWRTAAIHTVAAGALVLLLCLL